MRSSAACRPGRASIRSSTRFDCIANVDTRDTGTCRPGRLTASTWRQLRRSTIPYAERVRWLTGSGHLPAEQLDLVTSAATQVVLPFHEASQSGSVIYAMTHGRCVVTTPSESFPRLSARTDCSSRPATGTRWPTRSQIAVRDPELMRSPRTCGARVRLVRARLGAHRCAHPRRLRARAALAALRGTGARGWTRRSDDNELGATPRRQQPFAASACPAGSSALKTAAGRSWLLRVPVALVRPRPGNDPCRRGARPPPGAGAMTGWQVDLSEPARDADEALGQRLHAGDAPRDTALYATGRRAPDLRLLQQPRVDDRGSSSRAPALRGRHVASASGTYESDDSGSRRRDESPDRLATVSNAGVDNFGHWLVFTFPLVRYYREYLGEDPDYYYVGGPVHPWHYDSFAALGIDGRPRSHRSLSREIACCSPAPTTRVPPPTPVSRLQHRHAAEATPAMSSGRRVYISRGHRPMRRVLNEAACEELLAQHGFDSYRTEELTLAQETELFADAEAVVAPPRRRPHEPPLLPSRLRGRRALSARFRDSVVRRDMVCGDERSSRYSPTRPCTATRRNAIRKCGCVLARDYDTLVDLEKLDATLVAVDAALVDRSRRGARDGRAGWQAQVHRRMPFRRSPLAAGFRPHEDSRPALAVPVGAVSDENRVVAGRGALAARGRTRRELVAAVGGAGASSLADGRRRHLVGVGGPRGSATDPGAPTGRRPSPQPVPAPLTGRGARSPSRSAARDDAAQLQADVPACLLPPRRIDLRGLCAANSLARRRARVLPGVTAGERGPRSVVDAPSHARHLVAGGPIPRGERLPP